MDKCKLSVAKMDIEEGRYNASSVMDLRTKYPELDFVFDRIEFNTDLNTVAYEELEKNCIDLENQVDVLQDKLDSLE